MTFKQRDRKNLNDIWQRFKRMVKACPYHSIPKCVLMEKFYFELSKDTHQTTDIVFVGGMLRSSYNKIKSTLDAMASDNKK